RDVQDELGVVVEKHEVARDRDAHRADLGSWSHLESLQDDGVKGIIARQAGDAQTNLALGPPLRRVGVGHGFAPLRRGSAVYPRPSKNSIASSCTSPGRSPRNAPRFFQAARSARTSS